VVGIALDSGIAKPPVVITCGSDESGAVTAQMTLDVTVQPTGATLLGLARALLINYACAWRSLDRALHVRAARRG
jgi:hypothetical protein